MWCRLAKQVVTVLLCGLAGAAQAGILSSDDRQNIRRDTFAIDEDRALGIETALVFHIGGEFDGAEGRFDGRGDHITKAFDGFDFSHLIAQGWHSHFRFFDLVDHRHHALDDLVHRRKDGGSLSTGPRGSVPEPTPILLFALALATLGLIARRKPLQARR